MSDRINLSNQCENSLAKAAFNDMNVYKIMCTTRSFNELMVTISELYVYTNAQRLELEISYNCEFKVGA